MSTVDAVLTIVSSQSATGSDTDSFTLPSGTAASLIGDTSVHIFNISVNTVTSAITFDYLVVQDYYPVGSATEQLAAASGTSSGIAAAGISDFYPDAAVAAGATAEISEDRKTIYFAIASSASYYRSFQDVCTIEAALIKAFHSESGQK
jgi:hypothetical protein